MNRPGWNHFAKPVRGLALPFDPSFGVRIYEKGYFAYAFRKLYPFGNLSQGLASLRFALGTPRNEETATRVEIGS